MSGKHPTQRARNSRVEIQMTVFTGPSGIDRRTLCGDFFQRADQRLGVARELHRTGISQKLTLATHSGLDQIAEEVADEAGGTAKIQRTIPAVSS